MDVLPQIQPCTPEAYELIHQGLLAFTDSTQNGMRIDLDYCQKQTKILKSKIKINQKKFKKSDTGKLWRKIYPNYNFNSGPQLQTVLFDKKKGLGLIPNKKTKKDNNSTDNEVLDGLTDEIPEFRYYLKAKKYDKILNTYSGNFIKETVDGVMQPVGNLHTTVTLRTSVICRVKGSFYRLLKINF